MLVFKCKYYIKFNSFFSEFTFDISIRLNLLMSDIILRRLKFPLNERQLFKFYNIFSIFSCQFIGNSYFTETCFCFCFNLLFNFLRIADLLIYLNFILLKNFLYALQISLRVLPLGCYSIFIALKKRQIKIN